MLSRSISPVSDLAMTEQVPTPVLRMMVGYSSAVYLGGMGLGGVMGGCLHVHYGEVPGGEEFAGHCQNCPEAALR